MNMKITTQSSKGKHYFEAFTDGRRWTVQRLNTNLLGNTYQKIGTADSRQGVLDLCVHNTPGTNARVVSVD